MFGQRHCKTVLRDISKLEEKTDLDEQAPRRVSFHGFFNRRFPSDNERSAQISHPFQHVDNIDLCFAC